jgi:nucleotide-binding universal stress UspA family protein
MSAPYRKVVIGVDGSANARRTVAFVARLQPAAAVTVVQVVEPVRPPSMALLPAGIRATLGQEAARMETARRRHAERQLAVAAQRLEQAGWRVRTQVRTGVPIDEILAAVDETNADLLAVGARGAGDVAKMLLGSVAEGALKRCSVPTLVVR